MTLSTARSFCRACHNGCPVRVEVSDGRVVSLTGDPDNDVYSGFTCVKGRAWPEDHNHPRRLLTSQRQQPDGAFAPVSYQDLIAEVAPRLKSILDRHGPRSIAVYAGTKTFGNPTTFILCKPFLDAIGSPMLFTSDTIDQPGKHVAKGFHGIWLGGPQAFDEPDVALIMGANPLLSYSGGLPMGNPGRPLQRWLARGLELIVVDPRRTETAKRATVHLQSRPGEDVPILAGLLRVILAENLFDQEFVATEVTGLDFLRRAVDRFTPEYVGNRADVAPAELSRAARMFAAARRGYAVAATGANMSGAGTVVEYLVLCLNTVCGRWLRAGERVAAPFSLHPQSPPKAQASPPSQAYGIGEPLSGSGAYASLAGYPTAALPAAILHGGQDGVKALICCGGNPVAAWPDQLRTIEAMNALELLVQVDVRMSATARLADYVVAPRMGFEMPSVTVRHEEISRYGAAYMGYPVPWAQWTDAFAEPPPGSDVVAEWELFFDLAREMGVQLRLNRPFETELDMQRRPSTEGLLEMLCGNGRVTLAEVKERVGGGVFPDPPVVVAAKDADCTSRLDVGNTTMMDDLAGWADRDDVLAQSVTGGLMEFRLISRRAQHAYNSSGHDLESIKRPRHNPAFMHPHDLERLGLASGDVVEISSERAKILAYVGVDDGLRPGLVSMTHAYGDVPERELADPSIGSNVGRLLSSSKVQPYTGQPLMSDVAVRPHRESEAQR